MFRRFFHQPDRVAADVAARIAIALGLAIAAMPTGFALGQVNPRGLGPAHVTWADEVSNVYTSAEQLFDRQDAIEPVARLAAANVRTSSPAPAQGELQPMVEEVQRLGKDRYVNALLSESLGLGAFRHPIKYLSALEGTREFAVSRAEGLNPPPVILSRRHPESLEAYFYLTFPQGELQAAVRAIKGQGFFRVQALETVREDFARQKTFWLFEYLPKQGSGTGATFLFNKPNEI